MNTITFLRLRNGYLAWSIVYIILSFIGGSINCAEWGVNACLCFALVATFRVHLSLELPDEL